MDMPSSVLAGCDSEFRSDASRRIVVIDNYDSFTYNVVQLLARFQTDIVVVRNDAVTVADLEGLSLRAIVVSPGPGTPEDAGVSIDAIRAFHGRVPILGICLGHQCLAEAFGGDVIRAHYPEHGKVWEIFHRKDGLFAGLPAPFRATRYHSLVIDPAALPERFRVHAWTSDGTIMAVQVDDAATFGVQFHPESVMTDAGAEIVRGFMERIVA
jgi:anthranilate synthase/aminodeoxychorismate synthase-like glutamine amidotransferase